MTRWIRLGREQILVSCQVRAELTGSPYEFDVQKSGWADRSLLSTDTARWSWFVTPKIGGTHTLVVEAVTGLVVAQVALAAALGFKKLRKKATDRQQEEG